MRPTRWRVVIGTTAAAGIAVGATVGAGNDRIRSRDGRAETVDCTSGNDSVRADRFDRLLPSCGADRQPHG